MDTVIEVCTGREVATVGRVDSSHGARLARLADGYLTMKAKAKKTTKRSYLHHLNLLATYLGPSRDENDGSLGLLPVGGDDPQGYSLAAAYFVSGGRSLAVELAIGFRTWLRTTRLLRSGSVNIATTVLRGLAVHANDIDLIDWYLPKGPFTNDKVLTYQDTQGPGADGFVSMLVALEEEPSWALSRRLAVDAAELLGVKNAQTQRATLERMLARHEARVKRDRAILWLLGLGCGMRRAEVTSLDLEHVDLAGNRLEVLRKSRGTERAWVPVSPEAVAALVDWIEARGSHAGPLFTSNSKGERNCRLTGEAVWRIVSAAGRRAELRHVRPHGLRHAAITHMLDLDCPYVDIQAVSGHVDPKVIARYDDNRKNRGPATVKKMGADVASRLAKVRETRLAAAG
jgi:hypothetical protein